jgi:hypothetical protein
VLVEDGAESGAARPTDRRWGRGSTRGREAEPVLIRHSLQQARSGSGGGRRWRVELRQGRERALDLMRDSSSDVEKRRGGAGGELNGRPAPAATWEVGGLERAWELGGGVWELGGGVWALVFGGNDDRREDRPKRLSRGDFTPGVLR